MDFQLQPVSEVGRRVAALAEEHALDFATRAEEHDRERSFPFENVAAMQSSGLFAACVPPELGGLGLEPLHDLTVGINRLARGDGATALAAAMHLGVSWQLSRQWSSPRPVGHPGARDRIEGMLRAIGAGQLVLGAPASEPGADFLHCRTTATEVEGGWVLNGRKVFGTQSPAAHLLAVPFRMPGPDGEDRLSFTFIPRDAPGVAIKDNWDALGMRASGSNDIVLTDCFVPAAAVRDIGPWGRWSARLLVNRTTRNLPLAGAFLGIAEAARDLALAAVKSERRTPGGSPAAARPGVQHLVAEIEIDLATARAMLERTCLRLDDLLARHGDGQEVPLAEAYDLMKDFQCTKWTVNRKAIDVVDRALTAAGGAGYMSRHPLSRLYRDVRAGPFMQPLSPTEAFEYIGKVTLGLDPNPDL